MLKITYKEALEEALLFLQNQDEATIRYLIQQYKHWALTDWLIHQQDEIPAAELNWLKQALLKLKDSYPVQYITGYETFYEREFKVTEDTLIPRPETELLVEQILLRHPDEEPLTVVDLGTGTGAIAITLKKERPSWQVIAIDLSPQALTVAKENARRLEADVDFRLGDLLAPLDETIDLFVSNPPYIAVDEWGEMDESVRQFEPKLALFAENEGLAIYQRIAADLPAYLANDGAFYLEIGHRQGTAVKQIMQSAFPQHDIEVLADYSGLDRMIIGEKE